MRTRCIPLLAGLLLLVAACGDSAEDLGGDEALATPPGLEELGLDDPAADLDDDTAALVGDTTIPRAEVDARLDQAAEADEELAAELDGEQGEQLRSMFRADTLTIMIQTLLILDGADELGVEPSAEGVEQSREQLVDELGGQEAFDEALAQSGMSDEAVEEQLRATAALDAIGEHLVAQGEVDAAEAPEGLEDLGEQELAVQQWLAEQILDAEIVVHPEYGRWNAQSGQVQPVGGMGGLPGEVPEQ